MPVAIAAVPVVGRAAGRGLFNAALDKGSGCLGCGCLAILAVVGAVLFGLAVDQIYAMTGISASATIGQAAEFMPLSVKYLGAFLLLVISIKPVVDAKKHLKGAKLDALLKN